MRMIAPWFLSLVLGVAAVAAGAEFDALLTKVPSNANVIMMLNADYVFNSPIATQENWREKRDQAFASGLTSISPDTKHLVLASQLDFEVLQPMWTVAAAEMENTVSLPTLARQRKGGIDQVDGKQAVVLKNDTYIVEFAPRIIGAMSPANRQVVARWVRESQAKTSPQLSPFLATAVKEASSDAIVQAIDLEDAIPADIVRNKLKASPALTNQQAKLDEIAKVVASIRGLLLEVRLTDQIAGRIVVVFREDVTPLEPVAKALLLEVLAENGLAIDDLKSWNVEPLDKRLIFKGSFTKSGAKRVLGLLDQSIADMSAAKKKDNEADAYMREKYQQQATLKYFQSIESHLKELKGDVKDGATWGQMAQWIDYWARQIDRMPQLDVDPEMLDYGGYVTSQLRDASAALRGIGIRSGARKAQVIQETKAHVETAVSPYMYGGPYNGYGRFGYTNGYFEWRDVEGERRAITAEEKAKGATDARGIAAQLADASAKIRRRMTEKYHVEFK